MDQYARIFDKLVTAKQAAEILGISRQAIMDRVKRGTLGAVVVHRGPGGEPLLWMIPRDQLGPPRRSGRPKGKRSVPPPEASASPAGTDFLEEAAAGLPDEAASDVGTGTPGTTRLEDWLRELDDGGGGA